MDYEGNYQVRVFLNRMRYKAGTEDLGGLKILSMNGVSFLFKPAMSDEAAYGLFDYMQKLCDRIDTRTLSAITVNATAYLIDNRVPFAVRFKWDPSLSIRLNLAHLFYTRHFRRTLRKMKRDVAVNPATRWMPCCEEALFRTDRNIRKGAIT